MKRLALLVAIAAAIHAGHSAHAADPASKGGAGFGPNDVEVRLRDGSIVRGEIAGSDTIALKTPYGVLTFPLSRIVRIKAGYRLAKQKEAELLAALKDLDSDDFGTRGQAQRTLEELGAQALDALRDARNKASAEARSRIDAVLKKIMAAAPKLSTDDLVKSDEFEAAGTLQFDALLVKSRIGELKVKLEDIEAVRWLANGVVKSMPIEARAGLEDWIDTGVDAIAGDRFAIAVSGSLTLFGQNTVSPPEGTNNWGQQPFQTGAVIGKLGAAGKPFLIGPGKQWAPDSNERLYVKIFASENAMNNNNNPSQGEYKIKLATGIWAEEMAPGAGDSDAGAGDDEQGQAQGMIQPFRRFVRRRLGNRF